jgi:hypothetical protein
VFTWSIAGRAGELNALTHPDYLNALSNSKMPTWELEEQYGHQEGGFEPVSEQS